MTELEMNSGTALQECLDDLGIHRGFVQHKIVANLVFPDSSLSRGNIAVTFRKREINGFASVECDSDQLIGFLTGKKTLRTSFEAAWTRFQYSAVRKELSVESLEMPIFKLRF